MSKSEWQPYCDGPADRRRLDTVTIRVENDYEDGHHSEHEAVVPAPEKGAELDNWFSDVCYEHTGDGHNADDDLGYCYTITIVKAADPELVGKEAEWSGK